MLTRMPEVGDVLKDVNDDYRYLVLDRVVRTYETHALVYFRVWLKDDDKYQGYFMWLSEDFFRRNASDYRIIT